MCTSTLINWTEYTPCRQMSEVTCTSGVSDGLVNGDKVSLLIRTWNTDVMQLSEGLLSPVSSNRPHAPLGPTQLRRIHTITDRFSMANTYLIAEERLVVVDPGSELNVDQLQGYLQRFLRRAITDIDLIVLTHVHFGYTTGVEILRHLCNAPVAASSIIRELATGQRDRQICPKLGHVVERVAPRHFDLFPPDYEGQMNLIDLWLDDVEGLPNHPDWRVIASPGHRPEGLCLYNPFTWELLCGDAITIQGGAPVMRRGANRCQLEETLSVLRSLRVYYLYPTHGRGILGRHPLNNVAIE
jgi:hydroxyacylglutathione hydrolase